MVWQRRRRVDIEVTPVRIEMLWWCCWGQFFCVEKERVVVVRSLKAGERARFWRGLVLIVNLKGEVEPLVNS